MTSSVKAIHAGFRELGITEDDDKRALYARVTGQSRLSLMSADQESAVLTELRRLGFRPAERRANGAAKLTGRYAKKLQAMWIAAWHLGVVPDRDDAALIGFVKRQTDLDGIRFVHHADDARAVIEALKARMKRDAGVQFGTDLGCDWLASDVAKMAWAQWRIIRPDASLMVRKGFDEAVAAAIGRRVTMLVELTDRDWQAVMKALGPRVRGARKAGTP
ncbi:MULTISPECIES: regulatory protein GemA [unclassified Shinella]|uniref:regulatory protein GemA n=1 Tax=unclassified Shinella TaxID=2643062 RepID=UPI00225DA0A6|nr:MULTISPECIES: regulatory protein GemA [unclassified Shinella]MCO5139014.1 regulatory protein GemA [Shinella sp.]MDC7256257.1 regulatory protein GemA [Shinella sp. YE25]CAI0339114.1 Regulatory protein GemA [Rhizobiaceae bacterium]CAK7257529.1 Regulatory protein GemA [Shinella sp. WSC3-e]